MDENNEYVYVRINEDKIEQDQTFWFKTKCRYGFLGKIINQCWDTFYFELYNTNTLVAIPIKWIKWMAPLKDDEMEKFHGRN